MRLALTVLAVSGAALLAGCGGGTSAKPTPTTVVGTTAPAATPSRPAATNTTVPATTPTTGAATTAPPSPSPSSAEPPTATAARPPPPPPPPPTEPPPASGVTLTVAAPGESFSTRALSAPAGPVTIVFDNQDTSLTHNIHFFSKAGSIGMTEVMTGPVTETLALGALAPGSYSYKCDVHPQTMTGVLTVS